MEDKETEVSDPGSDASTWWGKMSKYKIGLNKPFFPSESLVLNTAVTDIFRCKYCLICLSVCCGGVWSEMVS